MRKSVGVRRDAPMDLRRLSRRDFLKLSGSGIAGAALLGTAGCGVFEGGGQGSGGSGGGGGGSSFSFDLGADIVDLNSSTTTDSVSFDVLNNVMEGLYRLDENEQPEPALAEGVEISGDQLTYTFTLREGLQWSNGDPLVAEDFRFALLNILDPDTAGQYSFIVADYIQGGAEYNAEEGSREDVAVQAPDDRTLEITLVNPTPYFLGLTSFISYFPIQEQFYNQQGDQYAQSAEGLLYCGPFTMGDFNPASGATLQKNDSYWDSQNVAANEVTLRIVKEVDTRVNLFESGELDVGEVTSEYVEQYRNDPAFNTIVNFATFYLLFNKSNAAPAFQNENIRRAILIGFDRESLTREILNDGSVPAEGYVPPGMDSGGQGEAVFREVAGSAIPQFDPQEARRLYQQGVEELGEEPTLQLLHDDTSTARDTGTFLQSQLQENLGATVELNPQPFDRRLELVDTSEFQFAIYAWIGDYNDPTTFLDLFLSDSPFNTNGYDNPRYDELLDSARTETDPQAREQSLVEAEQLLVTEDVGIAPIYHEGEARLIRSSVSNLVLHPYGAGVEFKPVSLG